MNVIATAAPVLLVGDSTASDRTLHLALRRKGYVPADAPALEEAIEILASVRCSAVIIDFDVIDGIRLALLRRAFAGPVLAVCSDNDEDIVRAAEWGVDDVLTAPIRIAEFYGRIACLLRRSEQRSSERLEAGDLALDFGARRVLLNGAAIRLTRTEFEILAMLIRNRDRVTSQQEILEHVWGPYHGEYAQTLRVHVGHIRKKIEPDPAAPRYLITEPGVGYTLRSASSGAPDAGGASPAARAAAAE